MFNLNLEPLAPKLLQNKDVHMNYRVICFTSASGSKPLGNIKNNRISQVSSSNKTNKVEGQSRSVKSRKNKKNRVDKSECNTNVMQSVLDANSISESVSRTFTIVRNRCPLTRITSTKIVPPKESTIAPVITPTQGILVYSKRPKASRFVGSNSKVKNVESNNPNSTIPNQSYGSTVFDVPSSSLIDCRLSKLFCGNVRFMNDHIAKIIGYGDYQMGNVIISRVYYVEGLGHNLFSVGQFCDSDLKVAFRKPLRPSLGCGIKDYLILDLGKLKPKADIGIFVGYAPVKKAFRIYNKRTRLIIETIHVDFHELTAMASKQFSSGCGPKLLTPGTICLGLVPNVPSSTLYIPPTKNDWEILFQPMFDKYLNHLPSVDCHVPAPEPVISTGTPSSTTIDEYAPSTSTSQTTSKTPSPVILLGVKKADHDIEVAHMDNNPFVEFLISKPSSEESSTQVFILNNVRSIHQPPEHINKWTKDHPIDKVIGDPSRFPLDNNHKIKPYYVILMLSSLLLNPRVTKMH
nr:integrase, catalytic region, zinc finger, CCHC-type, peptidase aspartic, catalytic [Tanacetum cinerariifolium]